MASTQQQKDDPKEQLQQYKTFLGARVLWPPECADDIIEGAIKETQNALQKFEIAREGQKIAEHLKKYMDDHFDPYWHVFFGKNFGCQAVHNKNRFIYFYIEKTAFLISIWIAIIICIFYVVFALNACYSLVNHNQIPSHLFRFILNK